MGKKVLIFISGLYLLTGLGLRKLGYWELNSAEIYLPLQEANQLIGEDILEKEGEFEAFLDWHPRERQQAASYFEQKEMAVQQWDELELRALMHLVDSFNTEVRKARLLENRLRNWDSAQYAAWRKGVAVLCSPSTEIMIGPRFVQKGSKKELMIALGKSKELDLRNCRIDQLDFEPEGDGFAITLPRKKAGIRDVPFKISYYDHQSGRYIFIKDRFQLMGI